VYLKKAEGNFGGKFRRENGEHSNVRSLRRAQTEKKKKKNNIKINNNRRWALTDVVDRVTEKKRKQRNMEFSKSRRLVQREEGNLGQQTKWAHHISGKRKLKGKARGHPQKKGGPGFRPSENGWEQGAISKKSDTQKEGGDVREGELTNRREKGRGFP